MVVRNGSTVACKKRVNSHSHRCQGDWVNLEVTGREKAESVVILLIRNEDHWHGGNTGCGDGE